MDFSLSQRVPKLILDITPSSTILGGQQTIHCIWLLVVTKTPQSVISHTVKSYSAITLGTSWRNGPSTSADVKSYRRDVPVYRLV